MVEQLGLAMIPSCQSRSSGLTWETTSGTDGSMRQALELSTTTQPRFAASGASAFEVAPPAEKSAMSMPSKASGVASSTVISRPSTVIVVPAERDEARRRSSVYGKLLLEQDLDHGPADGAGGADDGDGEGVRAGFGHGPTC